MTPYPFFISALAAYAGGAGLALSGLKWEAARKGPWLLVAAIVGVVLHTLGIGAHCVGASTHYFTAWSEVLGLLAWALAVGYALMLAFWNMRALGALVLPVAAVLLGLALAITAPGPALPGSTVSHPLFPIHVVTAFLGYGLFLTACAISFAYLQEHRLLKRKAFSVLFRGVPSLEKLERASTVAVWIGLGLFSVALYTGAVLVKSLGKPNWYLEPHVVSAGATWLVFLVLALGHLSGRLAGRTAAKIVLAGAALAVLMFCISHPFYNDQAAPSSPEPPTPAQKPSALIPISRIGNTPPVAVIMPVGTFEVGYLVTLDGTLSRDPDTGDILEFKWSWSGEGLHPLKFIVGDDPMFCKFIAEKPGQYGYQLVVNDGKVDSEPAKVLVNIIAPQTESRGAQ